MMEPISRVPCPFCDSTFVDKVEVKGGFRLRCPCCDAQTGVGRTDEILKGFWERRPFKKSGEMTLPIRIDDHPGYDWGWAFLDANGKQVSPEDVVNALNALGV